MSILKKGQPVTAKILREHLENAADARDLSRNPLTKQTTESMLTQIGIPLSKKEL